MADEYSFFERCAVQLSDFSSTLFSKWGKFVATSPLKVILTCVAFMLALSSGLYRLSVDNDPEASGLVSLFTFSHSISWFLVRRSLPAQSIWVPPTSQTALQQDAFNAVFSPFYRIEQVIFTKKPEAVAQ